ncbi:MAG: hypothetical protein ACI835_003384 [Planctomycetota bacterium]
MQQPLSALPHHLYERLMNQPQSNDPLHGMTLKAIVEELEERHGWEELSARIRIRCFSQDPSVNSSLKFLRKTSWARVEVEQLFVEDRQRIERNRIRNQRRATRRAQGEEQDPE